MRDTMPRNTRASLENLEAATSDDKPVAIPPGARVRVDFETPVDTSSLVNDSRYSNELAALAATELEDEDDGPELDPVIAFCTTWSKFDGYLMHVTRLPDPGNRRVPGQTYNRTCLDVESLGTTTFDPRNFEGTLQIVNGNSGGVFRVWLLDHDARPIPGAHLTRVAVNDPINLKRHPDYLNGQPQYITPPEVKPSALELRMQDLQEKLLTNALTRLLEPPPSQPQQPPTPTMSDEDRLTLLLVREGNLLPTVVQKLATLAGAPDTATAKQTWSDWLKDTGGELLRTNPEIGERITNTLANVVTLVLDRLPGKQQPAPSQPQSSQPRQLPAYSDGRIEPLTPRAAVNTGLPEAPDADEDDVDTGSTIDDVDIENQTMIVLEDLVSLLSSNEPLRPDHPVFIRLNQEYPLVFQQAIALIAQYPLESIILWVKGKGAIYAGLLDSEATGPHFRKRLQELKTIANAPAPARPNPEQVSNANTENPQAQGPPKAKRRQRTPAS